MGTRERKGGRCLPGEYVWVHERGREGDVCLVSMCGYTREEGREMLAW